MTSFVVRRIAITPLILLFLVAVVFTLQQVSPVDPGRAALGPRATAEQVEQARERLGYNDPLSTQYVRYVGDLAEGNLGVSLRTSRPVADDIRTFLPATVELALFSVFLMVLLGVLLGVSTVGHWRGAPAVRLPMLALASAPAFLLALLGLLVLYRDLGWVPASGRTSFESVPTGPTNLLTVDALLALRFDVFVDALHHLLLPAFCIAIGPAVGLGRVLRSGLVAAFRADYARTARSKGLTEWRVVWRHGLRNAAGPALAVGGLLVGAMFAGVVVVEQIFSWPGVGQYAAASIDRGDFPAIAGITLILGVMYVLINLLVDLLQAAADPRIVQGRRSAEAN